MGIHRKVKFSNLVLPVSTSKYTQWGNGITSNVTFENMIIKSTSYTTNLNGVVGSWIALLLKMGKKALDPSPTFTSRVYWLEPKVEASLWSAV